MGGITGTVIIVSHFLFHQIDMACAVNVLDRESIHLVLLNVVRVFVERVS